MNEFENIQAYLQRCKSLSNESDVKQMRRDIVNEYGKIYLRTAKKNTPKGQKIKHEVSENAFNATNTKVTIVRGKVVDENRRYSGIKRKIRKQYFLLNDSEDMRRKWGSTIVKDNSREVRLKIFNSASYSLYVDVGHRQEVGRFVPILGKRLKQPFVKGLHITDKSRMMVNKHKEKALKRVLRRYIERKLHK